MKQQVKPVVDQIQCGVEVRFKNEQNNIEIGEVISVTSYDLFGHDVLASVITSNGKQVEVDFSDIVSVSSEKLQSQYEDNIRAEKLSDAVASLELM